LDLDIQHSGLGVCNAQCHDRPEKGIFLLAYFFLFPFAGSGGLCYIGKAGWVMVDLGCMTIMYTEIEGVAPPGLLNPLDTIGYRNFAPPELDQ
jgi:hypothetical protein